MTAPPVHVIEIGPAGGAPLVVLHGGPGEAHDCLRPHLDRLASERRKVVYYDQRGGGVREHVAELDGVRRHLGVDRVDLLGFSWGSLLALLYALEHRANAARLVLVSPVPVHAGGGEVVRRNVARAAARPEVEALCASLAEAARGADVEAARRARFAMKVAPCFADPTLALSLAPVEARADVADAVERSLGRFDLRPRLAELRARPALVVHGAEDPVSAAFAGETADLLGAARVVLDHAGHAPFVEAAGAFVAAVTGFLDGA